MPRTRRGAPTEPWRRYRRPGLRRTCKGAVVEEPNGRADNAVGAPLRVRAPEGIQDDRPDPGQPEFAGQHQPVGASARDDHSSHLGELTSGRGRLNTMTAAGPPLASGGQAGRPAQPATWMPRVDVGSGVRRQHGATHLSAVPPDPLHKRRIFRSRFQDRGDGLATSGADRDQATDSAIAAAGLLFLLLRQLLRQLRNDAPARGGERVTRRDR